MSVVRLRPQGCQTTYRAGGWLMGFDSQGACSTGAKTGGYAYEIFAETDRWKYMVWKRAGRTAGASEYFKTGESHPEKKISQG